MPVVTLRAGVASAGRATAAESNEVKVAAGALKAPTWKGRNDMMLVKMGLDAGTELVEGENF